MVFAVVAVLGLDGRLFSGNCSSGWVAVTIIGISFFHCLQPYVFLRSSIVAHSPRTFFGAGRGSRRRMVVAILGISTYAFSSSTALPFFLQVLSQDGCRHLPLLLRFVVCSSLLFRVFFRPLYTPRSFGGGSKQGVLDAG